MTHTAYEVPTKVESEELNAAVSFSGRLDAGEKLIITALAVLEITSSDLTITGAAISTKVVNISGVDVPIGEAVLFNVAGGNTAGSPYAVSISVDTDSTPKQKLNGRIVFNVHPLDEE